MRSTHDLRSAILDLLDKHADLDDAAIGMWLGESTFRIAETMREMRRDGLVEEVQDAKEMEE